MRFLYRVLLWLHPPAFRRQFAGEMLWIFDETAGAAALWLLLGDALLSLARQWLFRSGAWKLLVASAGGLVQITAGGLGLFLFRRLHVAEPPVWRPPVEANDLARLMYMVVCVFGGLVCSVLALARWVKNFTGRRIHHDA
jgi:hypothetical protein